MRLATVSQRESATRKICNELNKLGDLKTTIKYVISEIKNISRCEAVAIRLEDNGDYPYYTVDGLSDEFIKVENSLCQMDEFDQPKKTPDGSQYLLSCMCGKVIRGHIDKELPFFTKDGAFWTNDSIELVQNLPEEIEAGTRGYCVKSGYRSIALIPIKTKGNIIGLIQLMDKRCGMVTSYLVEFIEMIAGNIGTAILNAQLYSEVIENIKLKDKLEKNQEELKVALKWIDLRTEFFSNLSHEMRTPLNIMYGSMQILEIYRNKGLLVLKDEKVEKQFKVLNQNCLRMIKLVNNLLDITRMDTGFYAIKKKPGDIIGLIKNIVDSVKEYLEFKGVKIMFSTKLKSKIILLDWNAIERVMLNLLSNAAKFTDVGGEIQVSVGSRNHKTYISVKDNGTGISKDNAEVIFDRFRQTENIYTKTIQGSGLGLAIVKSLVELHGGSISVKSTLGVGSEFIILLPAEIIDDDGKYYKNHKIDSIGENINVEFSDIYK